MNTISVSVIDDRPCFENPFEQGPKPEPRPVRLSREQIERLLVAVSLWSGEGESVESRAQEPEEIDEGSSPGRPLLSTKETMEATVERWRENMPERFDGGYVRAGLVET